MPLLLTLLALLAVGGDRVAQVPEPVPPPAPLVLRVDLPDLVPAGMVIPFRLTLANRGERPARIDLRGRPIAFDLVVLGDDSRVVWRRLEAITVEPVPVGLTLAAGEVLTFEGRWDQRDREGRLVTPRTYRVRGILPVRDSPGGWGSAAHEVTIIP